MGPCTCRKLLYAGRAANIRLPMKLLLPMFFAALFLAAEIAGAQATGSASAVDPAISGAEQQTEAPRLPSLPKPPDAKHNFYVEAGGFYSRFTPAGDTWRGADTRVIYSGWRRFTPFGGISTQGTSFTSQQNYGMGSYITFHKRFYAICGFSVSPESATIFYPRARFDVSAMLNVPGVKGLVFSTGFTELRPYRTGGGGRIFSLGGIYYHHVGIFSANVNFNEALPAGLRSTSGQFGFMHGRRGNYYFIAGLNGGKVAYQLMANVPFDVSYNTVSSYVGLQKWLSNHFGVIVRYDYQKAFDSFGRHVIKSSLFFEF